MATGAEFRFKIDVFTPETIPMARLAEYMTDLAKLLGEARAVHFLHLEHSSLNVVAKVDPEAAPRVEERVELTRQGEGPADAMTAFRNINRRLRADNGVGELQSNGAQILEFRGRLDAEVVTFPAFWQEGSALDGVVIKLGGTGDPVPVHLQTGRDVHSSVFASLEMARQIKHHMFDETLRLYGRARWLRDDAGQWKLERFNIANFEVLDSRPLNEVVAELRAIRGSDWERIADPWAELRVIRGEDEEPSRPN